MSTEFDADESEVPAQQYDFPKTLGECVDRAYKLRAKRLEIEKKASEVKAEESALKNHILNEFDKTEIEGARGKVASASISRNTVPHVKDWNRFMAWVLKTKSLDMFEKRVSKSAYKERLDSKVTVPGVEPFVMVTVNLSKR